MLSLFNREDGNWKKKKEQCGNKVYAYSKQRSLLCHWADGVQIHMLVSFLRTDNKTSNSTHLEQRMTPGDNSECVRVAVFMDACCACKLIPLRGQQMGAIGHETVTGRYKCSHLSPGSPRTQGYTHVYSATTLLKSITFVYKPWKQLCCNSSAKAMQFIST